jgi:hypothetical protein
MVSTSIPAPALRMRAKRFETVLQESVCELMVTEAVGANRLYHEKLRPSFRIGLF